MSQKKQSVYSQIAEDLLTKIQSDKYPVGTLLPPERLLMEIYGVERTTVRRGLELLCKKGHIKKVAGLGSVVMSKQPVENTASDDNASSYSSQEPHLAFSLGKCSILALFPEGGKSLSTPCLEGKITEKLREVCSEKGCDFNILSSSDAQKVASFAKEKNVDSCVIFNGASDSVIKALEKSGIKICFALCKVSGYRCMLPDIREACELAAEHLVSLGHTAIAFIGSDESSYLERELRVRFTDEVLKRASDSEIKQYTNTGGSDEKSGFERLSELIRRSGGKFTAVAAINDEVAAGAVKAAKYYRVSIPDQLSVVSLSGWSESCAIDTCYTNPVHLATEIYNACTFLAGDGYGTLTLCKSDLVSSKTTSKAKSTQGSARNLSDFLL